MKLRTPSANQPGIVIRGAGIIGLSIGWTLLRAGIVPRIFDPGRTVAKASWAAAGMLSADFEALIEPEFSGQLHSFAAHSLSLWPGFALELETDAKCSVHLSTGPSLALLPEPAFGLLTENRALGLLDTAPASEAMDRYVPGLNCGERKPVLFLRDGQVDNRSVLRALEMICAPYFTETDESAQADITIDCMGWQGTDIRPVKGQMLSLKPREEHPQIPVRWGAAYIVPKHDRTIIGASVEPDVSDLSTDDERLADMLSVAEALVPGLSADQVILEKWAGLRPMARRQRPVIGWKKPGRHYVATGHYRNGILLAPATAERVIADVLGQTDLPRLEISDLRPETTFL